MTGFEQSNEPWNFLTVVRTTVSQASDSPAVGKVLEEWAAETFATGQPIAALDTAPYGRFAGGLRVTSPDGVRVVYGPDGTLQYFARM